MATSKHTTSSTQAAPRRAAGTQPGVPVPTQRKAPIYPRVGFEEVVRPVIEKWAENPSVLSLTKATPEGLLALLDKANALAPVEADAKAEYQAAIDKYNTAHSNRVDAVGDAWRTVLYVNEQSRQEAKYDQEIAELFKPIHTFMSRPAVKHQRKVARQNKNKPVTT